MNTLVKYYLLCTTRLGTKAHILTDVPEIDNIFTKKELCEFLQKRGNEYIAREFVIGGTEPNIVIVI